MRLRILYTSGSEEVPSNCAALKGKPVGDESLLVIRTHAGLLAKCKSRADLHSARALLQGLDQLLRRAVAAGQPEGKPDLADLFQVHAVALAVKGLAALAQHHLA